MQLTLDQEPIIKAKLTYADEKISGNFSRFQIESLHHCETRCYKYNMFLHHKNGRLTCSATAPIKKMPTHTLFRPQPDLLITRQPLFSSRVVPFFLLGLFKVCCLLTGGLGFTTWNLDPFPYIANVSFLDGEGLSNVLPLCAVRSFTSLIAEGRWYVST